MLITPVCHNHYRQTHKWYAVDMTSQLTLNVFTDPNCPYAYSAEPIRLRLQWLYGDQLNWRTTMIILSGYADEVSTITVEQAAQYQTGIRDKYGMPIDVTVRPRLPHTINAARAFIAINRHDTKIATDFLRNTRIAAMSGSMLDEQTTLDAAAPAVEAEQLATWSAEPETDILLRQNAEAARSTGPLSKAFAHKLSKTSTGRVRYSAPSYQFIINEQIVYELPGFWPLEAYEAAIGNIVPDITRNTNPQSVTQVLQWANTALATIEVATVCARNIDEVRSELQVVADYTPVGQDGFWRLKKNDI